MENNSENCVSTSIQLRDADRAKIAADTAAFLARGGKIEAAPVAKYIDDPQAFLRVYKPPSNPHKLSWPINSMLNITQNDLKNGNVTWSVSIDRKYIGSYKSLDAAQMSRDSTRHKLKMKPAEAGQ